MNSCTYYQELISSLVDGELSDEENEALMLHLNTCSRCNAMYAVFHDLSDILSEEPEPLPEGLHENIMAGVRRSELKKRNRRMRRVGLRTAMTAAACAVLVLAAAVTFDPGKRADSVSIRAEEASQLRPSPSPAAGSTAPIDHTLPAATAVPVQTPDPMPARTPAPAQAPVPVYDTGSDAAAYTPVQPEPYTYNNYENDNYQPAAPLPVWTPEPAQPAAPIWTPAPAEAQTPAPAVTEAPFQLPEAFLSQDAPAAPETPVPAGGTSVPEAPVPADDTSVPEAAGSTAPELNTASVTAEPAQQGVEDGSTLEMDLEVLEAAEQASENAPAEFSLFSNMISMFGSAPGDQAVFDAAPEQPQPAGDEGPAITLSSIPLEPAEPTPKAPVEEKVEVYGDEARIKLLALIGSSKDELPQEAELTRLVHVTFHPEDTYGSEEKMDIAIYGDFVYCTLSPAEGGTVTYRADCSLRELDSFLAACAAAPAPSAVPTPDPYAAPSPVPTEAPAETPAEISDAQ